MGYRIWYGLPNMAYLIVDVAYLIVDCRRRPSASATVADDSKDDAFLAGCKALQPQLNIEVNRVLNDYRILLERTGTDAAAVSTVHGILSNPTRNGRDYAARQLATHFVGCVYCRRVPAWPRVLQLGQKISASAPDVSSCCHTENCIAFTRCSPS